MREYHNHRAEPYFTFLRNGQKTIEGRIKKGKYSFIEPGDEIVVSSIDETENVRVAVLRVATYSSIREMLEVEDLKKVLPDAESVERGVQIYEKFYTTQQQKEFGVVSIEVELIA